MNKAIETAAAAYIAPKLIGGFKFRYVVYGIAAYLALREMSRRGIFPKQTDAALGAIDQGLSLAKDRLGLHGVDTSLPH